MSNLKKFLTNIKSLNFDAFMVNCRSEFLDEFTPDHLNRLKYLTGFTGSNGIAIVGEKINALICGRVHTLNESSYQERQRE